MRNGSIIRPDRGSQAGEQPGDLPHFLSPQLQLFKSGEDSRWQRMEPLRRTGISAKGVEKSMKKGKQG